MNKNETENCTTCKYSASHKFATGQVSGKILCTVNARKNYMGVLANKPIKCERYERKP